ncbi:MAG: hypothetical protein ACFFG0_01415 [Candidatus Thorarchaeota archaeon]
MKLNVSKMIRSNTIFVFLKNQTDEYLKENSISKCETCKNTGIKGSGFSWNGTDFCEECEGIGFKGLEMTGGLQVGDTLYLCRNCAGLGCQKCNENGMVDWVGHAMG